MELLPNQLSLESVWWWLCWLALPLQTDVCAPQEIPTSTTPTMTEFTIIYALSVTGLLTWLRMMIRGLIYMWRMVFKRRTTLEKLLLEYKREVDKAQYDYLQKMIRS